MRRRLPNGRVDPSDQSKKQADLVVGPFSVPTHACSDSSLEIPVDVCACHPTATTYIQNYALSGPGQCGAGANVIENRKIGLNKERLKARTGYAFNAFGAETYGALGDGTADDKLFPTYITGDVSGISAGEWHSMFLSTGIESYACGRNDKGQLGDGTTVDKDVPTYISGQGA